MCQLAPVRRGSGFLYSGHQLEKFTGFDPVECSIPIGRLPVPVTEQLAQNVQAYTFPQQPLSEHVPQVVEPELHPVDGESQLSYSSVEGLVNIVIARPGQRIDKYIAFSSAINDDLNKSTAPCSSGYVLILPALIIKLRCYFDTESINPN